MANFPALGMRPHPLHSHAVRLCLAVFVSNQQTNRNIIRLQAARRANFAFGLILTAIGNLYLTESSL